jgi:hypothetical protein
MGRPSALNRDQQREALARREAGEALTPTHFTGFSIGQLPFSKGVVRAG